MAGEQIQGADYYRARATEMLEKAQQAESKATRAAYLNLARKWSREADQIERQGDAPPVSPTDQGPQA